jgi:putative SOS response-associated peptidase YedK
MCYSGLVEADVRAYLRRMSARIDYEAFEKLMAERLENDKIRVPRALEVSLRAENPRIAALSEEFRTRRTKALQEELFKQKRRRADAERTLAMKPTKAAAQSQRIATGKIEWALGKLGELTSPALTDEDSRIFPFWHAPVLVQREGQLVLTPMRYHCRPSGKPALYDTKYPGCYNARRDNLEGFWKEQFGVSHAVLVLRGFYENVARHDFERRALAPGEKPENLILNFRPRDSAPMLAAAICSEWQGPDGETLRSFALITDEPPPEVAAAGHDRCPIPLKPQHLQSWLQPGGKTARELYALLDERERPYYEHRLAA